MAAKEFDSNGQQQLPQLGRCCWVMRSDVHSLSPVMQDVRMAAVVECLLRKSVVLVLSSPGSPPQCFTIATITLGVSKLQHVWTSPHSLQVWATWSLCSSATLRSLASLRSCTSRQTHCSWTCRGPGW